MTTSRAPQAGGELGDIHATETLYDCYVRFMRDARRCILPLLSSRRRRAEFLQLHRIMSRTRFEECLKRLGSSPGRQERFERQIRAGYCVDG